ncbi:biotin/lipoyl-binding protein [Stutzerimonas stutzeri]|uniref:efflux RND transporter periplasmic adaptor subunit n=1 Tax=Stutzerimonas stutzeri TaxID=316 RepID=UPI002020B79E
MPRLSGVVEAVKVDLGEQVKQGQVLAVIASTDLSERRSVLRGAKNVLHWLKNLSTRKELWEERISAEQDYLQAQQALREAELTVANANAQLQALGSDAGKPDALSRYELRAPFDGMIVRRTSRSVSQSIPMTRYSSFPISPRGQISAFLPMHSARYECSSNAVIEATAFESSANGTVSYVGSLVGQQSRAATARVHFPTLKGFGAPACSSKCR